MLLQINKGPNGHPTYDLNYDLIFLPTTILLYNQNQDLSLRSRENGSVTLVTEPCFDVCTRCRFRTSNICTEIGSGISSSIGALTITGVQNVWSPDPRIAGGRTPQNTVHTPEVKQFAHCVTVWRWKYFDDVEGAVQDACRRAFDGSRLFEFAESANRNYCCASFLLKTLGFYLE